MPDVPTPNPFDEAAEILGTEANELARLLDSKVFAGMNYRVEIAVRTEMQRLRMIASEITKPK